MGSVASGFWHSSGVQDDQTINLSENGLVVWETAEKQKECLVWDVERELPVKSRKSPGSRVSVSGQTFLK